MRQNLSFLLEIDLHIDVGRVDRDVSEPGADGVDIDSGTKKMRSRRRPDSVGANRPVRQCRTRRPLVNLVRGHREGHFNFFLPQLAKSFLSIAGLHNSPPVRKGSARILIGGHAARNRPSTECLINVRPTLESRTTTTSIYKI